MSKTNTSLSRRLATLLEKPRFFRFILLLLIVQAAWIALSGRYPMAFDEDFHLGIIRLYAHHISPFWNGQPTNADTFGAIARDPSYLYQYLMSFPFRLINVFTHDQTIQVLVLRALNIALFAGALELFRRLLLKSGAHRAAVHFCLLVFVLVPIVPLLAAQINYDNLLLPLTALVLLLSVNFSAALSKRRLEAGLLAAIIILCLLTSLVKYAFLPIAMVVAAFIAVRLWGQYGSFGALWKNFRTAWRRLSRFAQASLVLLLVVSGVMFVQRYGVNMVRYHAPVPECSQVLSVKQCSHYGPWIRDYNLKIANFGGPRSLRTFTADWFYGMWLRSYFAVDGPATDFQTRGPLAVPAVSAAIFTVGGVIMIFLAGKRAFKKYDAAVIWLFAASVLVYTSILWLDDYQAYMRTGQPVAINGRYLLPVFLPALLIAVLASGELLKKKPALRTALAATVIICLAWGGGALTYILRSSDAWYWPSPVVRTANHAVQRGLGPITPGYRHRTEFLP